MVRKHQFVAHLRILLALAVAGLLLGGCSINDDDGNGDAELSLAADDNSGAFEVSRGDTIVIELDSNPTTGYEWSVDEVDESVITYRGSAYEAADGNLVGQGGTQTLTFQAANSGDSEIHLKYWRSWEGDSSVVERFDVTITVSSD